MSHPGSSKERDLSPPHSLASSGRSGLLTRRSSSSHLLSLSPPSSPRTHHHHSSSHSYVHASSMRVPSGVNTPNPTSSLATSLSLSSPESFPTPSEIEKLTSKERESRLLHHSLQRDRLRTGMHLIDAFVAIGAKSVISSSSAESSSTDMSCASPSAVAASPGDAMGSLQDEPEEPPSVMFSFPPNINPDALNVKSLTEFCFPEGKVPQRIVKRPRRRNKETPMTPSRIAMMAVNFFGLSKDKKSDDGGSSITSQSDSDLDDSVPSPGSLSGTSLPLPPETDGKKVPVPASKLSESLPSDCGSLDSSPNSVPLSYNSKNTHHPDRPKMHHVKNSQGPDSLHIIPLNSHHRPENAFTFLVTGHTYLKYGICVYKDTVTKTTTTEALVRPICFCVVSPAPFINLHLEIIQTILDNPSTVDLVMSSPETLERLLSEVFQIARDVRTSAYSGPILPSMMMEMSGSLLTPLSPVGSLSSPSMGFSDALSPDVSVNAVPPLDLNADVPTTEVPLLPHLTEEDCQRIIRENFEPQGPAGCPSEVEEKKILFALIQYLSAVVFEDTKPINLVIRPEPFIMKRPSRDLGEESELLAEYTGEILFRVLPLKTILQIISAVLCDFKVILVSQNPRLLTSAVISLIPLIRPFEYQSSIIPMLPFSLIQVLEAPVPLLVGLTSTPSFQNKLDNFFIVNLNTGTTECTKDPPPAFPGAAMFIKTIEEFFKHHGVPLPPSKPIGHEIPPKVFQPLLDNEKRHFFNGLFQMHLSGFVENFHLYCISEINGGSTTSVFLKESFLEQKDPAEHEFFSLFLDSQIFKVYEDVTLRDLDKKKTEDRSSYRSGRAIPASASASSASSKLKLNRPGKRTNRPPPPKTPPPPPPTDKAKEKE